MSPMKPMKQIAIILILIAFASLGGCAGTIVPGLRLAPDESQKQSADAADSLAGRLAVTGARPGSAAALALARMTRPSAVYAGPPKEPIDLESLASIESGQWRHKADLVAAAQLRDDLRKRAMDIAIPRMTALAEMITEQKVPIDAVIDRMAAIATVSTMADELADAIPNPRSPDEKRSPEIDRLASSTAAALDKLSKISTELAARRPDVATVVDKTLDAVDKTTGKIVQTAERSIAIYEKYAPEIMGILSLAGLGAGGYAVKKRKDAGKAVEAEKTAAAKVAEVEKTAEATAALVDRVVAAIGAKPPTVEN